MLSLSENMQLLIQFARIKPYIVKTPYIVIKMKHQHILNVENIFWEKVKRSIGSRLTGDATVIYNYHSTFNESGRVPHRVLTTGMK